MDKNVAIVIGVVVALFLCLCLCLGLALGIGGVAIYSAERALTDFPATVDFGFDFETPEATPKPNIVKTPVPTPVQGASDTQKMLDEALIPQSDLREIAMRLKGIADIPEVVSTTPADHQEGDEVEFNASNTDSHEHFKVTARLIYRTENAYFFAENGVSANRSDVKRLLDAFQEKMYPTNREFFGSEWTPGVDGDPRLYILYARNLGSNVAGYYSSADQYARLAHEFSNEKEMFYINADAVSVDDDYLYSTLAHEFQHMIHWYHDRNEESWMNEGASELATLLNDYDAGGSDYSFVSAPDLQLNTWVGSSHPDFSSHYGAAFLFMTYFLDRFGNEATQALVADPANGMRAVEKVLADRNLTDPLTGAPITAQDVFADWTVANYLGDSSIGDGRYDYQTYASAPTISDPTETFRSCPVEHTATVSQYAADYYEVRCRGSYTLSFSGSQQVSVIPTQPRSGRYAFWSNRNDESDSRLTHAFDLSTVKSATLKFWMWGQIEKDFDYVYLVVSEDDGKSWQMIKTPSGTDKDITGNNLGWGYTGASGGGDPEKGDESKWIEESVDLSEYAGKKILVRFEYVTDAALNYAGLMVDDISIPELNYTTDFETDDGGWQGEGFVRMDNILAQKFLVQIIRQGDQTTVERVTLDANNEGTHTFELGSGETAVVVVSGITPYTTEVASYEVSIK